jgi:hypothetical protein
MNRLLKIISSVVSGGILLFPLSASALDRIAVTFTNGDLYLKEGPVNAVWRQETSGVNLGNYSLSGNRISLYDAGGVNKEVAIKEPAWNSPWNWAYITNSGVPGSDATKALVCQLSDGSYRLLVLRSDGSVVMKDGPWNTGWWSSTLQPSSGTVSDIVIGGDNIGVIMSDGTFEAKQLTPGKFSHPNNTPWLTVATNVTSASMSTGLVAYRDNLNNVYAKEGGPNDTWFLNNTNSPAIIYDNAAELRVAGERLCVLKINNNVECKENFLGSPSKLTYMSANKVEITSNRVAVTTTGNNAYLLEGPLAGPNSGWQQIGAGNISSLQMN